jgi:hypothetical protein
MFEHSSALLYEISMPDGREHSNLRKVYKELIETDRDEGRATNRTIAPVPEAQIHRLRMRKSPAPPTGC